MPVPFHLIFSDIKVNGDSNYRAYLFTHLAKDGNMEFNGQSVAEIKLYKFGVLLVKKLFFHKAILRKKAQLQ